MLAAYTKYEKEVGVLKMPKGYSAQGFVSKKATKSMIMEFLPIILLLVAAIALILAFFIWRRRNNTKRSIEL
jgi:cytoskeletal protein RodZ